MVEPGERSLRVSREFLKSSLSAMIRMGGVAALVLLPMTASAGVKVFDSPDLTLELGMRLQPRFEYETSAPGAAGLDGRRDFLIRRARWKANGRIQGVAFNFEWKIDATDQANSNNPAAVPATPLAGVENAWLQYPLSGPALELRVGLYDQPYSRDRLTSDSRQLAVDRGEVSNVPDALGLADNVVGLQFMGKTKDSRLGWMLGAFDNRFIPATRQDMPMFVGRVDLNLESTKDVFQDAHFGTTDKWCSLGLNGSIQNGIENGAGLDDSSHVAGGVDAMVDRPFGDVRVFVKGELSAIRSEWQVVDRQSNVTVKMVGAGILFRDRFQPFIRFDQVRGDGFLPRGGRADITYVGANFYQRGHSLKVQGDLRMQAGTRDPVDGARVQAQIDF
jgi:hypothetical protein